MITGSGIVIVSQTNRLMPRQRTQRNAKDHMPLDISPVLTFCIHICLPVAVIYVMG